jgi:Sulfotransferase family
VNTREDPSTRPIFVVGAVRSGTTLLRYMLCSHPDIYITPESNFMPRFFGSRPTAPLSDARAARICARMAEYKPFWRDWHGPRPSWADLAPAATDRTPQSLISSLYGAYARQYGKARWGDKSPGYVAHLELLSTIFPRSQIVHVIRDARDSVISSLENYRGRRFFYMDPYYAARTWREQVRDGIEYGRTLPQDRYHEVRYEEFTASPEPVLRRLCEFLGEEYSPEMAAPFAESRRHYHSQGIHRNVRKPVTTVSVGRWRHDLAPADQRLVQPIVADLLQELGYPADDVGERSRSERARAASLHSKYVVVDRSRRVLRALGVANPARLLHPLARRSHSPARPSAVAKVRA